MSYFSEAEHQVGLSAIYYILVIVGIQINKRLESHESRQFAFMGKNTHVQI